MLDLCLGCASQACGTAEKDYRTECCDRFICARCLNRRPRLRQYCIICSTSQPSTSAVEKERFSIDSFLEDDDEGSPPPDFDALSILDPPEYANQHPAPLHQTGEKSDAPVSIHYVLPTDTFQGIALSYGLQPRSLAKLNKLSPVITTSQPNLLHTRKFLLLPPGCRSRSPDPIHDEEEERRRTVLRQFQMQTKCFDSKVAATYLDQVYDARRKELDCVNKNRQARDQPLVSAQELHGIGGELQQAVEAYTTDLKWEERQRTSGKFTGSKLRAVPEGLLAAKAIR